MVKKDKKPRKTALAVATTTEEGAAPPLGWVAIDVQLVVNVPSAFDELVIELGCLGLVEEPDDIQALNAPALDPKRPITTDTEGVHVYFATVHPAGGYGLNLQCKYNDAVIGRSGPVAAPKDEAA